MVAPHFRLEAVESAEMDHSGGVLAALESPADLRKGKALPGPPDDHQAILLREPGQCLAQPVRFLLTDRLPAWGGGGRRQILAQRSGVAVIQGLLTVRAPLLCLEIVLVQIAQL